MKSFLEVEKNRRNYHQDGARNSIHRASLLIPNLGAGNTRVSFLNHFLLKRGCEKIGCRITAIDHNGKRIESRLVSIDAPVAYDLPLTESFSEEANSFQVEFFAADNIFFPLW